MNSATFALAIVCLGLLNCICAADHSRSESINDDLIDAGWEAKVIKYSSITELENLNVDFSTADDFFFPDQLGDFLYKFRSGRTAVKELQRDFERLVETTTAEQGSLLKCINAWRTVFDDLLNQPLNLSYSAHMLDAWAKRESGILEGNVRWPGHYYECWNAKGPDVSGKWCTAFMGYKNPLYIQGISTGISWGSCFPHQCSDEDVYEITSKLLAASPRPMPPLMEVRCPIPASTVSDTDIIAIVISSILGILLLIGTGYDIAIRVAKRNEETGEPGPEHDSSLAKVVLCFSVISNGQKILDSNRRPGTLPVLDGIRFISTTWVVLGHSALVPLFGLDNPVFANQQFKKFGSLMPITNGTFSVDTFFLLSGLLVAYLGMKHIKKTKGRINIPLMYLQRYLRLTPTYAFLILFSMGLYKYCGDGPYWVKFSERVYNQCKDVWFSNLLYFNNLYPPLNMCFSWGWYLADDMQFYILSPIFIILLYRWPRIGICAVVGTFTASLIVTGVLSIHSKLQPFVITQAFITSFAYRFFINSNNTLTYESKFLSDTYLAPWCRICVYMIGMMTGYILYVTKGKIKMHKGLALLGWCVATGTALAVIYGIYGSIRNLGAIEENAAAFYIAMTRPAWGFSVAWVIIACSAGYGEPIATFLNWKVFIPLSRLTYSAYLVHLLILQWYIATQEAPVHFLVQNIVFIFLGTTVLTFLWAFVISVAIEWPMMQLMKIIFSQESSNSPARKSNHINSGLELPPITYLTINDNSTPESSAQRYENNHNSVNQSRPSDHSYHGHSYYNNNQRNSRKYSSKDGSSNGAFNHSSRM